MKYYLIPVLLSLVLHTSVFFQKRSSPTLQLKRAPQALALNQLRFSSEKPQADLKNQTQLQSKRLNKFQKSKSKSKSKSIPSSKVSGIQGKLNLKSSIYPHYPWLSRLKGEEGQVTLQIRVNQQGEVLKATVIQSSGFQRLDRSALEAVRQANFHFTSPPPKNQKHEIKVLFQLNSL